MCCPLTAGSTVPRTGTDHSGAQASRVEPRDLDDGGFLKMTLQLGLGGGADHMARPGRDSTSKEVGRGWRARTGSWTGPRSLQEHRSHDDGGTGSPPVHADLLVSLASLRSLGLGQRPEGALQPSELQDTQAALPVGLKWVGLTRGAPHQDPRVWGRGRPRPDKESGPGRGAVPIQRRQWLSVQASPRRTVGSCSRTAPRGGNPDSISALLTPQCREKPQAREGLAAWVTQHLSHSGHTHGCPPGPSPAGDTLRGN